MKKLLQSLFILLFVAGSAMAQQRTITGTVTGRDGMPIPGVTVRLKGTQGGTLTGANGKFSISVPQSVKEIEFSSLGYVTQAISIGTKNTIEVVLGDDSKSLNEVVVVAYGTSKREAITGSVSTLSVKDIEKRTVTSITSALAGLAPGISVGSSNGQPGTSPAIRLRGFGSFAASSSPLIVVDGAVFDGNIGDITSNDIESVSILKDAASSALYGSRAANGVIMISTKKGKSSQPTLSGSINQGFSTRGIPEYDRLNAMEYYPAVWQAMKNNFMYSGTTPLSEAAASQKATDEVQKNLVYNPFNVPNNQIVGTDGMINPNASLLYNDFDWYAPMQRTGKRTDANLNTSGRTERTDYYVSLGYLSDKGYILKSDFKRFNGRINVNSQVKDWLKTGLNISGSTSDANIASDNSTGSGSSIINAFNFARGIGPIYPVRAYDATGAPIFNSGTKEQWYDYGTHPGAVSRPQGAYPGRNLIYETNLNDNLYRRNLISARSYVDVKFLKDFTFTPSISIDLRNYSGAEYRNPLVGDGAGLAGLSSAESNTIKSFTFNQILNYSKSIGNHNFSALAAHENYNYNYREISTNKIGILLQGNPELDNFVTPNGSGGFSDNNRIESYFSKISYNFSEKYFFDASIRRDGSSIFAEQSRWGTFLAAGGSWAISKENFMSNVTWVDDLRLKASYGQVGNNALSNFYASLALYDLGWNNGSQPGALLASLASPTLKWESQNTFNTGVSFSMFGRRLYGELEVYKKTVDNLLFDVPQPLSDAVGVKPLNIGSMYNAGIELQLGGDVLRTKDFTWNLLTNWTMFKNRITKLPDETPTITSGTKRREAGKDYYAFYLRQFAGVDAKDGSALYIPADGTLPANIRTVNGVDYVINQSFAKSDYSGTAIPDLMGSFTNTFSYKGISLSFLVNYQIGGKFYDSNYQSLMSTSSYGAALHKDILKSWTQTNTTSNIPRADFGSSTNINATSSRWLIDASYISFRNVNLSYSLPKSLLGKVDVSNARIFVTAENLGVISKRKGLDPTEAFDGVNSSTYTQNRIVSFGLNFSL